MSVTPMPKGPDMDNPTVTPGKAQPAGTQGYEQVRPETSRLLRIATMASVAVALVLIAAKGLAWGVTGSVSVLSTLIDSLMDVGASLVNVFAVRNALKPADLEHRFGHGKAEPLAGLGQAAFVAGSSLFLVIEAVDRLITPATITRHGFGIGVMLFSIVATIGLVAFQSYVVRRTKSLAISADSLHYKGDVLIHGSVIVSLLVNANFGVGYLDPLFGVAIALYLLWNARTIAVNALHELMDRELGQEDRDRVVAIAMAHPEVRDIHDLRTRSAGPRSFIQFHLELDKDISLRRAHEISDDVEAKVRAAFPGSGVIIHQDPQGVIEHRASFDDEKDG
ncbi:MAG: cation diffusion facilitator family transporter [Alphaproteobacteria bacterium]